MHDESCSSWVEICKGHFQNQRTSSFRVPGSLYVAARIHYRISSAYRGECELSADTDQREMRKQGSGGRQ